MYSTSYEGRFFPREKKEIIKGKGLITNFKGRRRGCKKSTREMRRGSCIRIHSFVVSWKMSREMAMGRGLVEPKKAVGGR